VGCIPKKLFHQAARLGDSFEQADAFGWRNASQPSVVHDWQMMVSHVQGHVQGASFGYMSALIKEGVESINARGRIVGWDPSASALRVEHTAADGSATEMLAGNVVVAVGTRPRPLELLERLNWDWSSGRVITSDDLFSMARSPGRTLVLGGGYVALECAGFLQSLGHPTTIANRTGTFLRGFDQDATALVVSDLEERGVRVLRDRELSKLRLADVDSPAPVHATLACTAKEARLDEHLQFDTVLIATGRTPRGLDRLGALDVGARLHASGKFIGGAAGVPERITPQAALYAVGDVLEGLPELTPVAISQGIRVARMAAAGSAAGCSSDAPDSGASTPGRKANHATQRPGPKEHSGPVPAALREEWAIRLPPPVDALAVPTAVFTPLEYACVGLSEDQARKQHGDSKVDVVWAKFDTLEQQLANQVHWKPDSKVRVAKRLRSRLQCGSCRFFLCFAMRVLVAEWCVFLLAARVHGQVGDSRGHRRYRCRCPGGYWCSYLRAWGW
jgi:pyruvate/2-oxoglutarate dehydrogenase complex dihydrolipoamide dehydrogenase (E3) component